MKQIFEALIKSCNDCIVKCEIALKACQKYSESCKSSCISNLAEKCGSTCQKLIESCYRCIHECNLILENEHYETDKQKQALIRCIKTCQESIKRCQTSTSKILDKNTLTGCQWAIDTLNECIAACDECIESFED